MRLVCVCVCFTFTSLCEALGTHGLCYAQYNYELI